MGREPSKCVHALATLQPIGHIAYKLCLNTWNSTNTSHVCSVEKVNSRKRIKVKRLLLKKKNDVMKKFHLFSRPSDKPEPISDNTISNCSIVLIVL